MSQAGIVIVGAGHSGGKAAAALRKNGWKGPITLIGNESRAPYDRPPLSKAVLLGKKTADQCAFFSEGWYAQNDIELVLNRRVIEIDRRSKRVTLVDDRAVPYHRLLLATGAEPNHLKIRGADLPGVRCLRTVRDAHYISQWLREGQRVVIVGAGFIGLEVAAAAIDLGCSVHLLEAAPRALTRSLPEVVSSALIEKHHEYGVQMQFGVSLESIEGDSRVIGVRLTDGQHLPADCVIYGIGVRPNVRLAEVAGLESQNGIVVDQYLRTSDPDIFACGDVSRFSVRSINAPSGWKAGKMPRIRQLLPRETCSTTKSVMRKCRGSGPISTTLSFRSPDCRCVASQPSRARLGRQPCTSHWTNWGF